MFHPSADIRLVVTDSGLGGLDVAARLVARVWTGRLCRSLGVTFVDCIPTWVRGYHDLADDAERAAVFSRAMAAMREQFQPDAMVIACNTLSVLYPRTSFAADAAVPVHGIIDSGCGVMSDYLREHSEGVVAMFSTPMTLASGVYARALAETGWPKSRWVAADCPGLAGLIQRDAVGDEIEAAVDQAVGRIIERLADHSGPVGAALCCTHFGYVGERFLAAFARHGRQDVTLLNPNERLAEQLTAGAAGQADREPTIDVRVVSTRAYQPQTQAMIAAHIAPISPQTAAALRCSETIPLFDQNA